MGTEIREAGHVHNVNTLSVIHVAPCFGLNVAIIFLMLDLEAYMLTQSIQLGISATEAPTRRGIGRDNTGTTPVTLLASIFDSRSAMMATTAPPVDPDTPRRTQWHIAQPGGGGGT